MAVYVVSDLHGAFDDLHKAVPEGAIVLLLGDLINLVDYFSMTGILTEVFSAEAVAEVVRLRTQQRFEEAGRVIRSRSAGREDEVRSRISELVRSEYEAFFQSLARETYLILGNVDNPRVAEEYAASHPEVHLVDGQVVTIEGERFGFVGGALPTPLHVAGEITEEEMRAKVERLGDCDVLCSHIPPAVPELCFDTVSKKSERGSRDLLDYIRDVEPRIAYFGHVHQPLVSVMSIGETRCINVGYFRGTRRAWPHGRERDR
ncbi:MAG: metallophosphoesterase family protein [Actinomycetota bacterium]